LDTTGANQSDLAGGREPYDARVVGNDEAVAAVTAAADGLMVIEDVMMGGQASTFRGRTGVRGRAVGPTVGAPPERGILATLILGEAAAPPDTVRLRGRLLAPSETVYDQLAARLRLVGRTPILRADPDGSTVVLAAPGLLGQARQRVGVAAGLFIATLLSCLLVGAQMTDRVVPLGRLNLNLLDGIPFAGSLLAILLAHEFGHYLTARRLGDPVSLPYFIPMPFGPFGTLGAFINMTAPPRNRRHLLAIAAAGPLAGFIVALPVLWIGLGLSDVRPVPPGQYSQLGNSLLMIAMTVLKFGKMYPTGGQDVFLHPIAYAGWAGLLVTALNLIPAGQLDGGHIFDALAGARGARVMFWVVLGALAVMSIWWSGWLLWVALVFFFGRMRVAPFDDVTRLTRGQRVLAVLMVLIFILTFMPIPIS
jgi:Zn-dependent protease